ncbi:hypothetical protein ACIGXI_31880 [Kitasatospora aureofaciens]|uniref:hypothetical protein n=1 Tax=Kitasatospora aureofaciens TaxID=1894 RepID=UPI0037C58602
MGHKPEYDGTEQGSAPGTEPKVVEHRDETLAAAIDRLEDLAERIDKIRAATARDKRVGTALSVGGLVIGMLLRHWPW